MKLSEIKNVLAGLDNVAFVLPDGTKVPEHFHVTEVGVVNKHFIDCGGTSRYESKVNFQLWNAHDYDHRLTPGKLLNIIHLCEQKLSINDNLEVEVEYQGSTIGRYALDFDGASFVLVSTVTDCLAKDGCGVPAAKQKASLQELSVNQESCCTPGGGCC
ncbi:DUF6428 family protein [Niabella sp. CC-SYL272]|uniref:DUF6428 family protein n=1 Tax=Niabella agricola TaxID=2891571 RepID=UPI001F370111|nr:DUF6428 family protein [Niabella agricola]MCF3107574.1 DUF6428 family protein [Niabella agricola]